MYTDLNKLAKEIVSSNQYCTIGSSNKEGDTWVSPVAYCFDNKYNFYFISLPNSKHAQNFLENDKITLAIFNSQQPFGEGVGLQIEGVVEKVSLISLPKVIATYATRSWPYMNNKLTTYLSGIPKVLKDRTYTTYKIATTKVWMNDPNS